MKGEPLRFIHNHHSRSAPNEYTVENCGYSTPCWIWARKKTSQGYAYITVDGKKQRAHVVYYERKYGPVPEGMELDHLCRRRGCVNPDHLEPTTHRINVLRGIGPTSQNARKSYCAHGHKFTPENTYIRANGNRDCRQCIRKRSRESKRRQRASGKA